MPITRCALVASDNTVSNLIIADASVDTIEGMLIIDITNNPEVSTEHIWNGTSFVPNAELQARLDAEAAEQEALLEQEASETE